MRRVTLWGVVVAMIAIGALGYLAGSRIQSPEEAAASAAPPEPTLLTAEVRHGRLRQNPTATGAVRWAATTEVTVPPVGGGRIAVLTAPPRSKGEAVTAGEIVAEVSYRPVFVLPGEIPMVQDLWQGDTGADVAALQLALEGAGYDVYDTAGIFGASTALAVQSLYGDHGLEPPMKQRQAAPAPAGPRAPGGASDRRAPSDPVASEAPAPLIGALRSELVLVAQLPATVVTTHADVGQQLSAGEPLVVLATGGTVVEVALSPADAGPVPVGTPATVTLDRTGRRVEGVVAQVSEPQAGAEAGAEEGGGGGVRVVVAAGPDIPSSAVGSRASVTLKTARGKAGLLVPASAVVISAADGYTVRRMVDGTEETVQVEVVTSSGGTLMVKPQERSALRKGDEVVVGVTR